MNNVKSLIKYAHSNRPATPLRGALRSETSGELEFLEKCILMQNSVERNVNWNQ